MFLLSTRKNPVQEVFSQVHDVFVFAVIFYILGVKWLYALNKSILFMLRMMLQFVNNEVALTPGGESNDEAVLYSYGPERMFF